tara:strand:- start:358 stop:813 length:456 start_codon:yes stop_codon:yes gene_type:complete
MSKLTDMHGYCTEFVVISEEGRFGNRIGDRLTLENDDGGTSPYFINNNDNDEETCVYIYNIKPYVAEIKQFDLVDVRSGVVWLSKPLPFLADISERYPQAIRPICVLMENGSVDTFSEMRKHEPKTEVKATVNGVEVELSEEVIKLITEQQ